MSDDVEVHKTNFSLNFVIVYSYITYKEQMYYIFFYLFLITLVFVVLQVISKQFISIYKKLK
jgi:hypothetical protein